MAGRSTKKSSGKKKASKKLAAKRGAAKYVRYFHIHEDDQVDDKQPARSIRQASKLPGEELF